MRPPFRRELAVRTPLDGHGCNGYALLFSYTVSIKYGIRRKHLEIYSCVSEPLLFVPQSLDRIELRGAVWMVVAEEDSYRH